MKPTHTDSTKICRPWNRIESRGEEPYRYLSGEVVTPHGIITVYSQHDMSRIDAVVKGRYISRIIHRGYTKRGLVTLAVKFAKELWEGKPL